MSAPPNTTKELLWQAAAEGEISDEEANGLSQIWADIKPLQSENPQEWSAQLKKRVKEAFGGRQKFLIEMLQRRTNAAKKLSMSRSVPAAQPIAEPSELPSPVTHDMADVHEPAAIESKHSSGLRGALYVGILLQMVAVVLLLLKSIYSPSHASLPTVESVLSKVNPIIEDIEKKFAEKFMAKSHTISFSTSPELYCGIDLESFKLKWSDLIHDIDSNWGADGLELGRQVCLSVSRNLIVDKNTGALLPFNKNDGKRTVSLSAFGSEFQLTLSLDTFAVLNATEKLCYQIAESSQSANLVGLPSVISTDEELFKCLEGIKQGLIDSLSLTYIKETIPIGSLSPRLQQALVQYQQKAILEAEYAADIFTISIIIGGKEQLIKYDLHKSAPQPIVEELCLNYVLPLDPSMKTLNCIKAVLEIVEGEVRKQIVGKYGENSGIELKNENFSQKIVSRVLSESKADLQSEQHVSEEQREPQASRSISVEGESREASAEPQVQSEQSRGESSEPVAIEAEISEEISEGFEKIGADSAEEERSADGAEEVASEAQAIETDMEAATESTTRAELEPAVIPIEDQAEAPAVAEEQPIGNDELAFAEPIIEESHTVADIASETSDNNEPQASLEGVSEHNEHDVVLEMSEDEPSNAQDAVDVELPASSEILPVGTEQENNAHDELVMDSNSEVASEINEEESDSHGSEVVPERSEEEAVTDEPRNGQIDAESHANEQEFVAQNEEVGLDSVVEAETNEQVMEAESLFVENDDGEADPLVEGSEGSERDSETQEQAVHAVEDAVSETSQLGVEETAMDVESTQEPQVEHADDVPEVSEQDIVATIPTVDDVSPDPSQQDVVQEVATEADVDAMPEAAEQAVVESELQLNEHDSAVEVDVAEVIQEVHQAGADAELSYHEEEPSNNEEHESIGETELTPVESEQHDPEAVEDLATEIDNRNDVESLTVESVQEHEGELESETVVANSAVDIEVVVSHVDQQGVIEEATIEDHEDSNEGIEVAPNAEILSEELQGTDSNGHDVLASYESAEENTIAVVNVDNEGLKPESVDAESSNQVEENIEAGVPEEPTEQTENEDSENDEVFFEADV